MTKSHVEESIRVEAERQDALAEKGALDELPFTRLRRYAKEPSQVYAIRIPVSRLTAIRRLASRRKEQPTALLREWVLERLDRELSAAEIGLEGSGKSRAAPSSAVREKSVRYRGSTRKAAAAKKPPSGKAARGQAARKKRGRSATRKRSG